MFRLRHFLTALLPLFPLAAAAQAPAASPRYWPGDAGKVIASPLGWDRGDLGRAGLVAAGAGLSFLWLDGELRGSTGGTPGELAAKTEFLGDGLFTAAAFGALYAYGGARGRADISGAALAGLESWAVSGLIVGAGKAALRRERPGAGGPDGWRHVGGSFLFGDGPSFPSGHSAAAFSSARVAAWYFRDSPAAPYLCYGLASLVAWSRVNDNEHWTSDAVVGAAVGYFTAGKILKLHEARRAGGAALLPVYGAGPGLTAVYRF